MQVFPCKMVEIFCTFPDCNGYDLIIFFSSRKSLPFYLRIKSSVSTVLIFQETSPTVVQTYVSLKTLIQTTYQCVKWFSTFVLL